MTKRIAQIAIAAIAAVTLASCIIISGGGESDAQTSGPSYAQEG